MLPGKNRGELVIQVQFLCNQKIFFFAGTSMKLSKSPKIDKGASQKVLMKKGNQQPLSSEFLELQLLKESQITQEFPSHFIIPGAKHAAIPPISHQISSPTPSGPAERIFKWGG